MLTRMPGIGLGCSVKVAQEGEGEELCNGVHDKQAAVGVGISRGPTALPEQGNARGEPGAWEAAGWESVKPGG